MGAHRRRSSLRVACMTVVSERAVVAVVRLEGESMQAIDEAFADLRSRVGFTLPKRRFGDVTVVARAVTVRSVSIRGVIGKVRGG